MTDLAIILITVVVLIAVQLGLAYYVMRTRREKRAQGEILEDELTEQVKQRAGYFTYWISWFMWLGIFILDSLGVLPYSNGIRPNWVIWSGIMIMWLVYTVNLLLARKSLIE